MLHSRDAATGARLIPDGTSIDPLTGHRYQDYRAALPDAVRDFRSEQRIYANRQFGLATGSAHLQHLPPGVNPADVTAHSMQESAFAEAVDAKRSGRDPDAVLTMAYEEYARGRGVDPLDSHHTRRRNAHIAWAAAQDPNIRAGLTPLAGGASNDVHYHDNFGLNAYDLPDDILTKLVMEGAPGTHWHLHQALPGEQPVLGESSFAQRPQDRAVDWEAQGVTVAGDMGHAPYEGQQLQWSAETRALLESAFNDGLPMHSQPTAPLGGGGHAGADAQRGLGYQGPSTNPHMAESAEFAPLLGKLQRILQDTAAVKAYGQAAVPSAAGFSDLRPLSQEIETLKADLENLVRDYAMNQALYSNVDRLPESQRPLKQVLGVEPRGLVQALQSLLHDLADDIPHGAQIQPLRGEDTAALAQKFEAALLSMEQELPGAMAKIVAETPEVLSRPIMGEVLEPGAPMGPPRKLMPDKLSERYASGTSAAAAEVDLARRAQALPYWLELLDTISGTPARRDAGQVSSLREGNLHVPGYVPGSALHSKENPAMALAPRDGLFGRALPEQRDVSGWLGMSYAGYEDPTGQLPVSAKAPIAGAATAVRDGGALTHRDVVAYRLGQAVLARAAAAEAAPAAAYGLSGTGAIGHDENRRRLASADTLRAYMIGNWALRAAFGDAVAQRALTGTSLVGHDAGAKASEQATPGAAGEFFRQLRGLAEGLGLSGADTTLAGAHADATYKVQPDEVRGEDATITWTLNDKKLPQAIQDAALPTYRQQMEFNDFGGVYGQEAAYGDAMDIHAGALNGLTVTDARSHGLRPAPAGDRENSLMFR
jgi:hypothetical protein